MQKLKIIQIIKTMDGSELTGCRQYLKSQTRKETSSLIKLFTILRKYHPAFEHKNLSKERVYSAMFGKEIYNDRKLWDYLSNLTGLLEEYLIVQALKKDARLKQKLLLEEFKQRKLYSLFIKTSKKLSHHHGPKKLKTSNDYLELLQLHDQIFFHPDTPKFASSQNHLNAIMDNLDRFFVLSKLRYACELVSREKYLAQQAKVKLLDEVRQLAEQEFLQENPLVFYYYNIQRLFSSEGDEDLFRTLKKQFSIEKMKIGKAEQLNILIYLLNYAVGLVNEGNYEYNKDIFQLYQLGLKKDLLVEQGRMTDAVFTNIAIVGSFVKAFKWTLAFIKKYEVFLEKNTREDAKKLSLGYWYYYKAYWSNKTTAYEPTIDLLKDVDFRQVLYGLRARSLLLRTYYEFYLNNTKTDDIQFILDFAKAAELYIKRNKVLSKAKKADYLNFIVIMRKLLIVKYKIFYEKNTISVEALQPIQDQLDNMKHSITRFWLREKLKELRQLFQQNF